MAASVSPRVLPRAVTSSPTFQASHFRASSQTARLPIRQPKPNNPLQGLETAVEREIMKLELFRDGAVAQIRASCEKTVREIRQSAEKADMEMRRKCEDLKAQLGRKLALARDSNPALKELKGLIDASDGSLLVLSFSLHMPKVDVSEWIRCSLDCKLSVQPVRPVLEQDLASPDYRRLKPLANYFERNLESISRPLQELFTQVLRGESCRRLQAPDLLQESEIEHFCTLLDHSVGVKELSLDGKGIGPSGGLRLSKTFGVLSGLISLNLRSNDLGDEGIRWIASSFPKIPSLTQLYLSSNNINTEGASHLARFLPALPHLRELSLSSNPISCKGTVFLGGVLPEMQELMALNLAGCNIGHEGALALLTVVGKVPKLRKIWIGNNELGQEGRKLLGKIAGIRVFH